MTGLRYWLLPMLLAVTAAGAADLQVTADPPLPRPNLVVNPGMEQTTATGVANWNFSTANPENFATDRAASGRSGPGSLHLIAHSGVMSGYWNQVVSLKPETDYVMRVWYRLGGGKMLCYAHAALPDGKSVDQRFYDSSMRTHLLVPVFLKPEYTKGADPNRWFLCRLPFRTIKDMNAIAVSLGIFFSAGEAWFDDASVTEAKTALTVKTQTPVTRVRVLDAEGKAVFDSGVVAAAAFEKTLPELATDTVYTIEATDGAGKLTTVKYPEEGH